MSRADARSSMTLDAHRAVRERARQLFGALGASFLLVLHAISASPALAHYRPLATENLRFPGLEQCQLELGVDFRRGESFPYSGLEGDLLSLGVLAIEKGIGPDASVFIRGPLYNRLTIHSRTAAPNSSALNFAGNSTDAVGNLSIGTKFRFREPRGRRPGLGFLVVIDLPNTPNQTGLGNDTFNLAGSFIGEIHSGGTELFVNLGFAILDDPTVRSYQKDKILFGLGLARPLCEGWRLLADYSGRTGSSNPGTEDRATARLAVQQTEGDWRWDAGVLHGLEAADANWGITAGVTRNFGGV